MNKIVIIDKEKCTGCGTCVAMCPARILYLDKEGMCQVTDEKKCDRLAGCQQACPAGAIHIN